MRKVLRISLYVLGSIVLLVLIAVLFIISPPGKKFVRDQAVSFLRNKLKTEVHIGAVEYSLPKMVGLRDVLFKDQARDTLLAARRLKVDIDMLALLKSRVVVEEIVLEGVNAHIYRNAPDTTFNYSYIIEAFAPASPVPATKEVAATPQDSSAALVFDLDRVLLDDIRLRFNDQTGGMNLALALNQLRLNMRTLDPDQMVFDLKRLYVNGLDVNFIQDSSLLPPSTPDTTAQPLRLAADQIELHHITTNFEDRLNNMLLDLNLGNLRAQARSFDLLAQQIDIPELHIDSTRIAMILGRASDVPAEIDTLVDTLQQGGWRIALANARLRAVDFKLDNEAMPRQAYGMDYGHLDARNLNLEAGDLLYTVDTISGNIAHLSVQEQGGLDLRELRTRFVYDLNRGGELRDLYIETPYTRIENYAAVRYPSLEALQANMATMHLNTRIENSIVGFHDVLVFAPQLRQEELFRRFPNGRLRLDALLEGYLNQLNIERLALSGLSQTNVNLSGQLNGLPDPDRISYDLNIAQLQSSRSDLEAVLPAEATAAIRLPDRFGAAGNVSGNLLDYRMRLGVTSTDGDAYLAGYVFTSAGAGRERYDLDVRTRRLNLGRILRQESSLGILTATTSVQGSGFDPQKMSATARGQVAAIGLMGYTYQGIRFDGQIRGQRGNINLSSADPNARLEATAKADLSGRYPAIIADVRIDSANLQALKLSTTDFRLRADIHADLPELNPDYPRGTVIIDRPVIASGGQRYFLDSMYIVSKPTAQNGQDILVHTDVLKAKLTGHIPLTRMGDVVLEHINRHYALQKAMGNAAPAQPAAPVPGSYDMQLNATVYDRPLLHLFLPDLRYMDTVNLTASIDPRNMLVQARMPRLVYADYNLQGGSVDVNGSDSALTYAANLERLSTTGALELVRTSVTGEVEPEQITARLNIKDDADKDRFALSAALSQEGNDQVLNLREGLLLDYKTWQVAQPNRIVFGPQGFYVTGLRLSSGPSEIAVASTSPSYNAPLRADIRDFYLSDITRMVSSGDTLIANGLLSGTVNLRQMTPQPLLDAALRVENLSLMNDTIGLLTANARSEDGNTVRADVDVSGRGSNINLAGRYYIEPVGGNNFDMRLKLDPIDLAGMEGVAMGQIRNSSGFIRGDLTIRGTAAAPQIRGDIKTDNAITTVSMLGSYMRMPDETIRFTARGINLPDFEIYDSLNNKIVIDGDLLTQNYTDIRMDLNVRANDWHAMHSTAKDNKLFYGDVVIDTRLNIRGTPQVPDVDGSLSILEGTSFTAVVPETENSIPDHEGIVEFVDMSDTNRYKVFAAVTDSLPQTMTLRPGSSINVNIEVAKEADFTVVIDQAAGDFVEVKGEAALNAFIEPDGSFGLVGSYVLSEGSYQFNYNFIKRRFDIEPNSSITFAGDPLMAEMNVTAVYEALVAPYDLVQREVGDPEELVYFKQRMPVNVELNMTGELMKPTLTFDIVLPEDRSFRYSTSNLDLVTAKLNQLRQDPSELNKQVFSLLLLNRFVGEDPFSSGAGGGGIESVARQSVSRFVGEQLNELAGSIFKGVDLNVDLTSSEDYTTGQMRNRTDLNVAASKQLLDDRLTITVGNEFELEGPTAATNQSTSLIPGNLAADYKLSPDGRYVVRAYRRNEDNDPTQGSVTQTGVNFIINLNYNRFRSLFISRKKRMQMIEERRLRRERRLNQPVMPGVARTEGQP